LTANATSLGPITVDQLIALNDEIVALARAGVPLDQGLFHLGHDLPGRLGHIATALAQRLEQGEGPARALDDPSLPPVYRAMVAAGIRTGRLPVALEGMASLLRRVAETRRMVAAALVYPLVVVAVAYVLFTVTVVVCFPCLVAAYADLLPGQVSLSWFAWLAEHVAEWAPWPPIVLAVLVGWWWFRMRRALAVEHRGVAGWFLNRQPSVASVLHAGRMATFADVLAVLVEHQVPLHEALPLAADASGDRPLRDASGPLAERLQRGERPTDAGVLAAVPPVLGWLLVHARGQSHWQEALRRAADSYRRRAQWMTRWLSYYLPVWLTLVIGGSVAVAYALSVFVPWTRMLYLLSQPDLMR
jgi:general secretion pathway protein F